MDLVLLVWLLVIINVVCIIFLGISKKQKSQWIDKIKKQTSDLAAGNISSFSKTAVFPSDLESLADELNKAASLLRHFAENSQVAAGQVAAAVEQISVTTAAARQLIRDFTRVESVARSLAEISAVLREEAQENEGQVLSCLKALSAARKAMDMIQSDSGIVASQADGLQNAVQRVDHIIRIIGEISDRTRLLALNAAIEAARAGEHGRGFAVVAQEVQALSENTADAVRDTKSILDSLGQEVKKMVDTVNSGKKSIEAGVTHTYTVEEGLAKISGAVKSMADNIEKSNIEITGYLSQVDAAADSQKHSLEEITQVGELLKKAALMLEQSSNKVTLHDQGLAISSKYDPMVEKLKKILIETAAKPEIISMNTERHRDVLTNILKKYPEVEAAWSNHADGAFIFSEPSAGLANARIRQWWQQAMAGENYVSEIYISAITRKPCLTLSVPIKDMKGSIVGVLGADLRLDDKK